MRGECPKSPQEQRACHQKKAFSDTHHLYWEKNWYKRGVEQDFRELPENKEQLCRCEHNEIHATTLPPAKPSLETMLRAIALSEISEQGETA